MADNETTADIIAEMRRNFADGNPYFAAGLPDRIEAAHKRECGDAAKLREALETALRTIRGVINSTISPRSNTVFDCRDKLADALAEPPRNCDVYDSYGDAIRAFEDDENAEGYDDMAEWLFAPATEGGAK